MRLRTTVGAAFLDKWVVNRGRTVVCRDPACVLHNCVPIRPWPSVGEQNEASALLLRLDQPLPDTKPRAPLVLPISHQQNSIQTARSRTAFASPAIHSATWLPTETRTLPSTLNVSDGSLPNSVPKCLCKRPEVSDVSMASYFMSVHSHCQLPLPHGPCHLGSVSHARGRGPPARPAPIACSLVGLLNSRPQSQLSIQRFNDALPRPRRPVTAPPKRIFVPLFSTNRSK